MRPNHERRRDAGVCTAYLNLRHSSYSDELALRDAIMSMSDTAYQRGHRQAIGVALQITSASAGCRCWDQLSQIYADDGDDETECGNHCGETVSSGGYCSTKCMMEGKRERGEGVG